ncbi:MAG: hypothetical protein AAF399_04805 [Bacteroidota bacterium]
MSVLYSILHVPLRVEADEQLSIGLLLLTGNEVFFRYSIPKLHLVKDLMLDSRYRLLKQALQGIAKTIKSEANEIQPFHFQLRSSSVGQARFASKEYLTYSSQYHHNLLTFTPPQKVPFPGNQTTFFRLYEKFIDHMPIVEEVPESPFHIEAIVSEKLYPNLEERVNLDLRLSYKEIPTLFLPTQVSFIGRNDAPMVGRVIDFGKRVYNLQHDLTEMYTLVKAFEENGESNGKYFVIGQEPSQSKEKEHITWATISRSKTVDYVDVTEIERVAEYAQSHGVEPFI